MKANIFTSKDVLKFLHGLDDSSVDLLCTDPPYNLKVADWDTFESQQSFMDFTKAWLDAALPKLKPTGSLFVFNTPFNSAFILAHLVERGLYYQNWITWYKKDGFAPTKKRFTNNQETCLYFTKDPKRFTFNADAVRIPYASTSRIEAARTKGILKSDGTRWFPNEKGKLCPDVWEIVSERHKNKINGRVVKSPHPTPKPIEMIERIVLAASDPGQLVVDPFSGTGTVAVACVKHGRQFICNDRNPAYNAIGRERVAALRSNAEAG